MRKNGCNIGWTECIGQYWMEGMLRSILDRRNVEINKWIIYVFLKHTNVIEISIFNYLN